MMKDKKQIEEKVILKKIYYSVYEISDVDYVDVNDDLLEKEGFAYMQRSYAKGDLVRADLRLEGMAPSDEDDQGFFCRIIVSADYEILGDFLNINYDEKYNESDILKALGYNYPNDLYPYIRQALIDITAKVSDKVVILSPKLKNLEA